MVAFSKIVSPYGIIQDMTAMQKPLTKFFRFDEIMLVAWGKHSPKNKQKNYSLSLSESIQS